MTTDDKADQSTDSRPVTTTPYTRRTKAEPLKHAEGVEQIGSRGPSLWIGVFVISLLVPISFSLGSIQLTPYRVVLILLFPPSLMALLSGQLGRITLADVGMILAPLWGALALVVVHGFESAIEPAGILVLETSGSYLTARYLVRDEACFQLLVRILFLVALVLLPLAAIESFTGRAPVLDLLRPLFNTRTRGDIGLRFGLHRAQVVFEHPILFGVFSASLVGILYYSSRADRPSYNPYRSTIAGVCSLFSLSSGAVAALTSQILTMTWDRTTKSMPRRWLIFFLIAVGVYVIVDLISTRSPFHVIISYLTFSSSSSYNRILIWNYGTAEVFRHPFFGIGFNEWDRPSWMSGSMDNFWLVIAVRYGLPAFLLLAAAIVAVIWQLSRAAPTLRVAHYRSGLLVSLGGMIIGACTVHYWNAIYCWFLFLVGCGPWIVELDRKLALAEVNTSNTLA